MLLELSFESHDFLRLLLYKLLTASGWHLQRLLQVLVEHVDTVPDRASLTSQDRAFFLHDQIPIS